MSGFSSGQLRALTRPLDEARVFSREVQGQTLQYIEGWFAIAEANAIFGYAGWDRQTVHTERIFEQRRADGVSCGYAAKVRICVHAPGRQILRDGSGFGSASAASVSEAHDRALKMAETDATKRALVTFGNRFGLGLYDPRKSPKPPEPRRFCLFEPGGGELAADLSPEAFCGGLRQLCDACSSAAGIEALARYNACELDRLRTAHPQLTNRNGDHYADILQRLLVRKASQLLSKAEIAQPSPTGEAQQIDEPRLVRKALNRAKRPVGRMPHSKIGPGIKVDKNRLLLGMERRYRDKQHLKRVAELPCVVCNRQPSHAHHLKFAQRRGMSQKVSDEYVVPLCALHHGSLHQASKETEWWQLQAIDPLPIASQLWATRNGIV